MRKRKQLEALNLRKQEADAEAIFYFYGSTKRMRKHFWNTASASGFARRNVHIKCGLLISCIVDENCQ